VLSCHGTVQVKFASPAASSYGMISLGLLLVTGLRPVRERSCWHSPGTATGNGDPAQNDLLCATSLLTTEPVPAQNKRIGAPTARTSEPAQTEQAARCQGSAPTAASAGEHSAGRACRPARRLVIGGGGVELPRFAVKHDYYPHLSDELMPGARAGRGGRVRLPSMGGAGSDSSPGLSHPAAPAPARTLASFIELPQIERATRGRRPATRRVASCISSVVILRAVTCFRSRDCHCSGRPPMATLRC